MPRGRPRSFDADAALDRAMRVFWAKGYDGASLTDLTKAMGINRPSLYAAFGDKAALFRKAIERYVCGPGDILGPALREATAREAVALLLRTQAENLACPGRPAGCLLVHGAMGDGEGAVEPLLLHRRHAAELAIRTRIAQDIAAGRLAPDTDAAALARFVMAVGNGMALAARAGATREELAQVAELALKAWPAETAADRR